MFRILKLAPKNVQQLGQVVIIENVSKRPILPGYMRKMRKLVNEAEMGTVASIDASIHATAANVTSSVTPLITKEEDLCPITLSCVHSYVKTMLIVLILVIAIGGILNGFFVSTIIIEPYFRKIRNVFLACIGVVDFTSIIVLAPIPMYVVLSKKNESEPVCRDIYFFSTATTYFVHLMFFLSRIQIYLNIRSRLSDNIGDTVAGVIKWSCGSVLLCCAVAYGDVFMGLGDDYCHRLHHGNFTFRITTTSIMTLAPFFTATLMMVAATKKIKRRARKSAKYRRSQEYVDDLSLNNVNIIAYLTFALFWLPHLVVLNLYPDASDQVYYSTAWIGYGRILISPLIYALGNDKFAEAFASLYMYCFHRTALSDPVAGRRRRAPQPVLVPLESVHVQILQSALQAASSPRRCELAAHRESYL